MHAVLHAVFEQRVTSATAHQWHECKRVESRINHSPRLINDLRDTPNRYCSSHACGPVALNGVRHRGQISVICGTVRNNLYRLWRRRIDLHDALQIQITSDRRSPPHAIDAIYSISDISHEPTSFSATPKVARDIQEHPTLPRYAALHDAEQVRLDRIHVRTSYVYPETFRAYGIDPSYMTKRIHFPHVAFTVNHRPLYAVM